MKALAYAASICIATLIPAALIQEDAERPEAPATEVTEQHRWLQQLVGEWDVVFASVGTPESESFRMESEEEVSAVGDMWIVSRSQAEFAGEAYEAVMTLGYDHKEERIVGSWIDSMGSHMWIYDGTLDVEQGVLTLNASGPAMYDKERTANYRDTIRLVDAKHRVMRSEMQGEDGTWTEFMRTEFTRLR